MDSPSGTWLTDEAITEAIRFRQAVVRIAGRFAAAGDRPDWFFGAWQPDEVTDPSTGLTHAFVDAPLDLLRTEPACWTLTPGADWHGFGASRTATACSTRSRSRSPAPVSTPAAPYPAW